MPMLTLLLLWKHTLTQRCQKSGSRSIPGHLTVIAATAIDHVNKREDRIHMHQLHFCFHAHIFQLFFCIYEPALFTVDPVGLPL